MEDSLVRILLMGLNRDLHLSTLEILDLTEILVKRAASLYSEGNPNRSMLFSSLFCVDADY